MEVWIFSSRTRYLKVFITQNDIFQTHRFKTGNFCYFSNSSDKKEYRLVGLTSCWKLQHTFYHIPGAIFSHMSIYLGQLVRFFCHGGTKLSFSRLSDGEPFLYCDNMFGLLLFKAYQFFKRIQRILKKLFKKIIFPGNILCTIQCKLPSFWGL